MNQKQMWIAGAVVVAVVIIVLLVRGGSSSDPMASSSISPSTSVSMSVSPSTSPATGGGTTITKAPTALTYQKALDLYKNTRIQINDMCQATPAHMVIKKGATVMFDNRSVTAHVVSLNGGKFTLPKYGFYTRTFTSVGTYTLDCGTSQNVAQITVEK